MSAPVWLQSCFSTDADCLEYLEWLRWPGGFVCVRCGHAGGWRLGDGRIECGGCGARASATAGTVFDKTRTPLTVWFTACWLFATAKDGISALNLQRTMDIGSYQTAWAMLHRLRQVLVRPGRELLTGIVEVDETFIGGEEPGLPGGRARGKKALVGVAVEVKSPKGFGRCRLAILPDASANSLHAFVSDHVESGATVSTDAWQGYRGIERLGYHHDRRSQRAAAARGEDPGRLLPGVHRVASLAKRWLLGTHQGAVDREHLVDYLNEFTFRFNRRTSRSRGLVFYRVLQLAVGHDPLRYRNLVQRSRPRDTSPIPPGTTGHPLTLERPPAHHTPGETATTPAKWRAQIEETGVIPDVNQIRLSPTLARTQPRAVHEELGIITESWSPIGRGSELRENPIVGAIAARLNKTPAQVLIRWHVQQELVPVPKSANPTRLAENHSVFDFSLSAEDMTNSGPLDLGESAARDSDSSENGH